MRLHVKSNTGFSLLELVIAIGVFVILIGGMVAPLVSHYFNSMETAQSVQAGALMTEGWETLRAIRNSDWAALTSTEDTVGGFTRRVTIGPAQRDPDGALVESGGIVDPDTKKVAIEITWQPTPYKNRTLSAQGLLTNYASPAAWPPVPPPLP